MSNVQRKIGVGGMMNKKNFTWDCLCVDDMYVNGIFYMAYVVSKDVCREKNAVIGYIVDEARLNNIPNVDINPKAEIKEGWCRYTVCNYDGERAQGYIAEVGQEKPNYGKGWFPVWIVKKDDICKESV